MILLDWLCSMRGTYVHIVGNTVYLILGFFTFLSFVVIIPTVGSCLLPLLGRFFDFNSTLFRY